MAIVNNIIGIKTTYWADDSDGVQAVKNILNTISTIYNWTKTEITGEDTIKTTQIGKFYISDSTYLQVVIQNGYTSYNQYGFIISLITPNETKQLLGSRDSQRVSIFMSKTSLGAALGLYVKNSNDDLPDNTKLFNFYIGEITKENKETASGIIYVAEDNTLTIATDDGISSEVAQTSTINADRTAILAPVVDTTYGNVFKDIYFMRSSPLNCNIMAVEGQGNFLCGKTLCLKDQEVGA